MKKIISQILLLVVGFLAAWQLLAQVPWIKLTKVREVRSELEIQLGEIVWDDISMQHYEITDKKVVAPVDSILERLCKAAAIEKDSIQLHIISDSEANAFALPDKQLVINSGLIANCRNSNELAGVMAHELAHITQGHVMQKLVQEIGLATLTSISTGNADVGTIVRILSSSAFSREAEREADITAVDYLTKANIAAADMANFLYRLGTNKNALEKYTAWMSTHPDTEERAMYIIKESKRKQGKDFRPVAPIHTQTMEKLKKAVKEIDGN